MCPFRPRHFAVVIAILALCSGLNAQTESDSSISRLPQPQQIQTRDPQLQTPSTEDFFRSNRTTLFPRNFQLDKTKTESTPTSLYVDPHYPVGPGDQFLVNFWGRIEDAIVIQINSESKLFVPRIGVIEAAGITYQELIQRLTEKLNASLKNVFFTISLHRSREFNVYVLGDVNRPGAVNASANYRVSQVIEAAGGVRPTGSRQFIELRRKGAVIRINLLKYLNEASFEPNPFITNDDVIFVPHLTKFVTVTGSIVQPGTFEIQETNLLREIIKKMGGLSVYADLRAPIRVSRLMPNGERKQLRVFHTVENRGSEQGYILNDFAVQESDEIFIPASNLLIPSKAAAIYVTGEVRTPGPVLYQISMTVEEYIGASGGLTSRADLSKAVVYKADGSQERIRSRMALEPGDTIHIPEKTFKFWQDHLTVVTAFISLATSIIVFSGR